jgi:hypothetical protein
MKKFEIKIGLEEEETGVYAISCVDLPAIEVNYIAMSKVTPIVYKLSETKKELIGPILIPDLEILKLSNKFKRSSLSWINTKISTCNMMTI